ncbi:MAG: DUF11 domain-containing protein, partial [Anaerolineae bacterium]|nr:DUF11 domain-containing protein [Anaerolineae bacterium]
LAHVYPAPGLYTAVVTAANHVSALTATTAVLVEETVADLALNQTDSDDPVLAGATLIYHLTATNFGLSDATQVTVVDRLPEGVEFVAAAPTCVTAARTVTCTIGDLAAGTTATMSITVEVPAQAHASLVNTAEVTAIELDPALDNNTAQETTAVVDRLCLYTHDFETPVGSEWSNPGRTQSPNGHRFLGEFGNETVILILARLPAHTFATAAFDLYVIRSWDGSETAVPQGDIRVAPANTDEVGPDLWEAAISRGDRLLYTTFSNWDLYGFRQAYPGTYPDGDYPARTGARENQSLGYLFETIPMDAIYGIFLQFAHTDDMLELAFSGAGLQPLSDESWGMDNIEVCFSAQSVSHYSVYLPLLSRQRERRGSMQGMLANPY